MNKLLGNAKIIEISADKSKNYIELVENLGYIDDYNANGIKIKRGEGFEESIQTLVNMPVVAAYKYDWDKGEDLGSHEVYETMDGDLVFATEAIGTHTEVWVGKEMVKPVYSNEEKEMECIYSRSRIWAYKYPKFVSVIQKLISPSGLGTSWEIDVHAIESDDCDNKNIPNARSTSKFEFLSNCYLGATVKPAYGEVSRVLEVSSEQNDVNTELSNALKEDLKNNLNKAKDIDKDLNKNKGNERSEKMDNELKALQEQLDVANAKLKEFEEAGKDAEIAELKSQLEVLKAEKVESDEKLVKASNTVETLTSEVEELKPFKEKVEAIEAEKAEIEKAEKIKELKTMVTKGGYVTEAEVETSEEIKAMIENCEEEKLLVLRANRILEKLDKEESKKETSETKEVKNEKQEKRNFTEENKEIANIMADFLA